MDFDYSMRLLREAYCLYFDLILGFALLPVIPRILSASRRLPLILYKYIFDRIGSIKSSLNFPFDESHFLKKSSSIFSSVCNFVFALYNLSRGGFFLIDFMLITNCLL